MVASVNHKEAHSASAWMANLHNHADNLLLAGCGTEEAPVRLQAATLQGALEDSGVGGEGHYIIISVAE